MLDIYQSAGRSRDFGEVFDVKSRLSNLRVLIVDDHFFMRTIWRTILMGLGVHHVAEASDAAEGFQLLNAQGFDVIFIDYHLGDLNGAEFSRLVRTSPDILDPSVAIIGCTADTRKSIIAELLNAGVDEVLAKPVSSQAAYAKLYAVCEQRRRFVRTPTFFGPDRRRRDDPKYKGPERRIRGALSEPGAPPKLDD